MEEDDSEQYFVGFGGLPNAEGVVQCDAGIMQGNGSYGAVCALEVGTIVVREERVVIGRCGQNVVCAAKVAREVMQYSKHTVLVGEG